MLTTLPSASLEFIAGRAKAKNPASTMAGLEIGITRSLAGLDAIGDDWVELHERAGRPGQVFQTHAFATAWARAYLDGNTRQELVILTARSEGRLVLVWPLVIEQRFGIRVLTWLGAPVAQYGDVLVDPGHARDDLFDHAWAQLRATISPDVARLRKVRTDAAIAGWLKRTRSTALAREQAPYVTLAAGATNSFDARQSAKARKNRRRLMRRLEEKGKVAFHWLSGCAEAQRLACSALAIKRRWLVARGQYSAAFADHRLDRLFSAALASSRKATGCTAFAITLDSRPIAVALGFAAKGRMTLHVIGYDLEHEKAGGGVLLLEAILQACEDRGFHAVDLLAPKAEYKMDWADGTVDVVDYAVPVSLKGLACVGLWDGVVRRAAKSALASLPVGVRRMIVSQDTACA